VVYPTVPALVLYRVIAVAPVLNLLAAAVYDAGMSVDLVAKWSRWTKKCLITDMYSDIM